MSDDKARFEVNLGKLANAVPKLLPIIAILATALPVSAAEKAVRITGMYSDLRYIEEAGDVLGNEIFIVFAAGGYTAFVQSAEGEPGVAVAVPVKVTQDHVSFTVPKPSGGPWVYDGRITAAGFFGTLTVPNNGKSYATKLQLRRKKSYWE